MKGNGDQRKQHKLRDKLQINKQIHTQANKQIVQNKFEVYRAEPDLFQTIQRLREDNKAV